MRLGEVELERVVRLRETLSPTRKKSLNGLRSYVRNKALLLSGLIARPICLR